MINFILMRSVPAKLWLLATLSALLQTLPFPLAGPLPLWRAAFSWVALLPFLLALCGDETSGQKLRVGNAALVSYWCGALWYLGNCYWVYQTMYLYGGLAKPVAVAILVLFCLYLGLYHALFGGLFVALRRSRLGTRGALLFAPFLWVAVELARARITGFPWDLLGYTQVDSSLLTRMVPYTGVYGLSFLVAAVNALWLIRIRVRERRYTRPLLTLGGVALVLLYFVTLRRVELPNHITTNNSATLVQENLSVGIEAKENEETPSELIASFSKFSLYPPADRCYGVPELASTSCIHFLDGRPEGARPVVPVDLISWPESPAGFESNDPAFRRSLGDLARSASAALVVGSLGVVPDTGPLSFRIYNSANVVAKDGTYEGRYDKIHLVPWGEYVPFKSFFSFADRLTAGVGNMDRGTERSVFTTGGHKIGVFICYESIFGDEVRRFVGNGAEVLVNISDDGWYGDTSAAWQHLNMVRMRAIENHRWILRSTNTGVTAAIDPYGRVTAAAPRHIRTALRAGFNYEQEMTFYTRHGDLFAYVCALVSVLAVGYSLIGRNEIN